MSFGYQILGFGAGGAALSSVCVSGNTQTTVGAYTVQSYTGDGNFKYQIQIYFGETLNDEGIPISGLENIFVSK